MTGPADLMAEIDALEVPVLRSLAPGEAMTKRGRRLARPKKGTPIPAEGAVQRAILGYLDWAAPKALAWHVKNENDKRLSMGANARRRALGRKAGVPDLTIVFPGPVVVFLEVKRPGGIVSHNQEGKLAHLARLGCHCGEVTSLDEAVAIFRRAGVIR